MHTRLPALTLAILSVIGATYFATRPVPVAQAASKQPAETPKSAPAKTSPKGSPMNEKTTKITKTDAQWRAELSPQEYEVLRNHGTERAFTGDLLDNHETGTFICAGCKNELFDSETKFDSGTGWPSFYQPINPNAVEEKTDSTYGMKRTEIVCARCGGHLGHVFEDGPNPTGLRYCMNSAALNFEKK